MLLPTFLAALDAVIVITDTFVIVDIDTDDDDNDEAFFLVQFSLN